VNIPIKYATKLDAMGNATFWQGYSARLGLGMTRIKNHRVASKPDKGKNHLYQV
jgi:hypothetical protein